ncbi:MAG: glycoside hydrolase family 9 protein [Lachnospiraceae bacterium]|nr:glycoside hydrolase family 9 protein [Lachnospiraceae bacterium]
MKIYVNQMGYLPGSSKTAILALEGTKDAPIPEAPGKVQICAKSGTYMLEKEALFFGWDEASGDFVWQVDFSEIQAPGSYEIRWQGQTSYPFSIGSHLYNELHTLLSKALYFQRCGMALEEPYAGHFARKTCHLAPSVLWSEYEKCMAGEMEEADMQHFDIRGGWHDAGDYGRYPTAAACALAHILYAYRFFPGAFEGTLNIPESGRDIPDILSECLYELKWMLQMQNEEGGVYHKQCTLRHANFVMPCEDREQMYLYPVSSLAVADFTAVMALASRIYRPFEEDFADQALAAALKSYDWLQKHPEFLGFHNPEETNTGEYGDSSDRDERMWAAMELYRCTGEEHYLTEAREIFDTLSSTTEFGWGDVSGFAGWALLEAKLMEDYGNILGTTTSTPISAAEADFCRLYETAFLKEAERLLETLSGSGYGVALSPREFCWGSNMVVLNRAMLFGTAYLLEPKKTYTDAVVRQMDYILGVNGADYSYVTGVGAHAFCNPHNRVTVADDIDETIPGFVSGGPNGRPADEKAEWLIRPGTAPMKCYLDIWECYSLNEITIYWNSPAIFAAAFLSVIK